MDLQIGLAIVDQMNGGKETKQCMDGWMHRESASGKRLRALGARMLVALATRLDPAGGLAWREQSSLPVARAASEFR